jgi:ATP-dependent DNA helicase UvrD/PcrA
MLREQLDPVRVVVRGQFAAACGHVQQIVSDAVPRRSSDREQAEWQSVVDTVIALALSCSSLDELEAEITEQSQSLRNPPEHAVVLSTIHSAKGLEWDTVFMVGVEDGVLPHINSNDVEEERRVAYVSMTRARRRLGLTYAGARYGERSRPSLCAKSGSLAALSEHPLQRPRRAPKWLDENSRRLAQSAPVWSGARPRRGQSWDRL